MNDMNEMIGKLNDPADDIRLAAVRELSRINSADAIPALARAVGDSSLRIREEALHAICMFPGEAVFPKLESFLRNHEDANLRNAAIEAFPKYGKSGANYLANLLGDPDEEVRAFAAQILGDTAEASAVDLLIKALGDDDENVRVAAVESLGKLKDPKALKPIIGMLGGDFWTNYVAISALGEIGDPMAIDVISGYLEDEMLREAIVEALGKIGDVSAAPIIGKALADGAPNIINTCIAALVEVQRKMEKHFVSEGGCLPSIRKTLEESGVTDHLIGSLSSSDATTRKNAAIALGWIKDKRAVEPLTRVADDYEIEECVVGALANIGSDAIDGIVEAIAHPDPQRRAALIRAIELIGDTRGVEAVIPLLDDSDYETRMNAISCMTAGISSEKVEDALIKLMGDEDDEIRSTAVEALKRADPGRLSRKLPPILASTGVEKKTAAIKLLGSIGNSEVTGSILKFIEEEDENVREAVYLALCEMGAEGVRIDLIKPGLGDKSPLVKKAAASCLGRMDRDLARTSLVRFLRDSDSSIRLFAAKQLGEIGDPTSLEALKRAYLYGDNRLRIAVIESIGGIKDKSANAFLVELTKDKDPDIRMAALQALAELKDRRSLPDILIALDDPEWSVRGVAIEALERIGDRGCVGKLVGKLNDPVDTIRKRAISALASLKATQAVNDILPLLANESLYLEVVEAAAKLGIHDRPFFMELFAKSNSRVKESMIEILGRARKPEAVDMLLETIDDEYYGVRAAAARALGDSRDKKAVNALLKLQRNDPKDEVRKEAAFALKKLQIIQ